MNRVLFLILILSFPINFILAMIQPLLANYVVTLGGDVRDAGNVFGVATWVGAISLILIPKVKGWLKIGDRPLLLLSFAFPIVAGFWYLHLTQIYQFYILQAMLSFGGAMSTPIVLSWYQNFLRGNFQELGWGWNNAIPMAAGGLGAIVAGNIVYHFGYRYVFFIYIGLAIFTYLVLLLTIHFYKKDLPNIEKILKTPPII